MLRTVHTATVIAGQVDDDHPGDGGVERGSKVLPVLVGRSLDVVVVDQDPRGRRAGGEPRS